MPPDKIKVYPEFATLSEELFPSTRPTRKDALAAVEVIRQAIRDHYDDQNGSYAPLAARIYADLVDSGHMQPFNLEALTPEDAP
jgi:hypothetical protein